MECSFSPRSTLAHTSTGRSRERRSSVIVCLTPFKNNSPLLQILSDLRMHPSLRCSSDDSKGDGTIASSGQRVAPVAAFPSDQSRAVTENSGNVIIPRLVHATPPPLQPTKTYANGRVFLNHNASALAQPGALATASLAPASSAVAGFPGTSMRSHIVNRVSRMPPVTRAGAQSTVATAGLAEGCLAVEPLQSPPVTRSGLGVDRRSVHDSTPATAIGVSRAPSGTVSLEIEGVQTGEEVVVGLTPARRRSSNISNSSGSVDLVRLQQLRRQLRKAEANLNTVSDGHRRQKQEFQQQQAVWSLFLNECEARLLHVQSHQASRERLFIQELSRFMKQFLGEMEAQAVRARAVEQAHANDKANRDAEHATLLGELEVLKAAAGSRLTSLSTLDDLQKEMDRLRNELDGLRQSASDEQRNLERKLSQTQTTLQSTEAEYKRFREESDKDRYLVAQCRLFIQQVCQPGFSVVNGPKLEPVEANRPEPTGFVLVPLTVLLYGYALLPEGDRQAMISHYDHKAKAQQ